MAKIPGFLTITEAAKKIGVSHSQAARYIRNGELDAIDLGGQKLVKQESAERFKRPPKGNPNFLKRHKSRRR